MHKKRYRNRFRRFVLPLFVFAAGAELLAACALGGMQTNPNDLLKQTISGLSGTDDFRFEGTTNVSIGDLPVQKGASFQGVVTGHNRLSITYNHGDGAGPIWLGAAEADRQMNQAVFSRKENEWVLTEAGSESGASMLLPWSPLYKLEQLNAMEKRVESARDASNSRLTVLTATPDERHTTQMIRKQLTQQAGLLNTDKKLGDLQTKHGLSERQTARLKGELEQNVQKTKQLVEQASDSLQATSVYRIWVDRINRLPQKMEVETEMTYVMDGRQKKESTRIDYTFTVPKK